MPPTGPPSLGAAWAPRFGVPAPWVAGELARLLAVAVATGTPPSAGLLEAAAGLGVLRAQQGHGAATLVEDVLALRPLRPGSERLTGHLDAVLRSAVRALVAEQQLPTDRTRDPLTGLLSRGLFDEALIHEVRSAERHGAPTLLVADLDGLTRYMESQGHLAGDLLVVRTAEIMAGSSRRSDLLGRVGVDQLALLLPRTDLPRGLVVARRVLARALADARSNERERPGSTAELPRLSVGVGWLATPAHPAELLAATEAALQRARRAGGGVVEAIRAEDAAA